MVITIIIGDVLGYTLNQITGHGCGCLETITPKIFITKTTTMAIVGMIAAIAIMTKEDKMYVVAVLLFWPKNTSAFLCNFLQQPVSCCRTGYN
jgi:tetrahydromethanopterin S-methyltransferase subunit C